MDIKHIATALGDKVGWPLEELNDYFTDICSHKETIEKTKYCILSLDDGELILFKGNTEKELQKDILEFYETENIYCFNEEAIKLLIIDGYPTLKEPKIELELKL